MAEKKQAKPAENVLILKKPVAWEDVTYERVTLDFEGLTGDDLEQVEDEFTAMGKSAAMPTLNMTFQRLVAAKAAGIPYEVTGKMSAADASAMAVRAQNFLLG